MSEGDEYGITVLHPLEKPDAFWHEPSPAPSNIVFDLVAVHGLNGHPIETWTHKETRVMWLRDLLPETLPHVRVMTYGYNAKFRNFTGQQDVRDIATKLLVELVDLRRSAEEVRRPLVFVCHSLGGIIAKKALLINCSGEQKQVQDSCYGMVFMGTPHNGSSLATCGKIVANIISACTSLSPPRSLLKTLRPDSRALFEISADFVERAKNLQLVSFFEMDRTNLGFFKAVTVVDRRSSVVGAPNEFIIGQNCNHRDIARFRSMNDRNFRPVVSRLQKFKRDLENGENLPSLSEISVQVSALNGTSSVFELPFPPCRTFHGRDDFLNHMKQYFHGSSAAKQEQLTFAICGLGGSGKTQTALQFAFIHRSRYRSGVIFINATSRATLTADFERIFDLMKLGETPNKTEAVKRWLSEERNKDWLLIFDNADNLESICISKYFPATTWGHIVITSRDHSAIGFIGNDGSLMEPLKVAEAVAVLLDKSGVPAPTIDDEERAAQIVELLGCLPLALDQAGAFIRTRQKTLADYIRLYGTQQDELLKFSPKLSNYDKSVLTAWEVNFKQVEDESGQITQLLLLLCFLDAANITESMLLRGCTSQKRWNKAGEIQEVSAETEGVDEGLIKLMTNEMAYDGAVEKLLSFSLVRRNNDFNEARSLSVHPLVQYCASKRVSQADQTRWRFQAILLVCHAFPRDQYMEDDFGLVGRSQLPHVARVLQEYDKLTKDTHIPLHVKHAMASCLIAASRFSDMAWKQDCIKRTKTILQSLDNCHLHASLAQRESALSRMHGNRQASQDALEKFIDKIIFGSRAEHLEGDARENAQRGELVISHVQNLILDDQLVLAKKELLAWQPLVSAAPSTMECLVLRSRHTNLGKVLRDLGDFDGALTYFEDLLQETALDEHFEHTGHMRVILCNIADLYCELERADDAVTAVESELVHMAASGVDNIGNGRQLKLCLAEGYIKQGRPNKAEETFNSLKGVLEDLSDPDIITKSALFRVYYGLARISHSRLDTEQAVKHWHQALEAGSRCGWNTAYPMNIARYSLAHALYESGDIKGSSEQLQLANVSLNHEEIKYWVVGLSTYWYRYVKGQFRMSESTLVNTISYPPSIAEVMKT